MIRALTPPDSRLNEEMRDKIEDAEFCNPFMIGSSTMRGFPHEPPCAGYSFENVAVDWSGTRHLILNCRQLVSKKPLLIVCYSGVNDVTAGVHTATIVDNVKALMSSVMCPFVYISIICGPMQQRCGRKTVEKIQDINAQLKLLCSTQRGCLYLDVADIFSEGDFVADGLHLNPTGYARLFKSLGVLLESRQRVPFTGGVRKS